METGQVKTYEELVRDLAALRPAAESFLARINTALSVRALDVLDLEHEKWRDAVHGLVEEAICQALEAHAELRQAAWSREDDREVERLDALDTQLNDLLGDCQDLADTNERAMNDRRQALLGPEVVTLQLPMELRELCALHGVSAQKVIEGFVADLCDLQTPPYCTNGSDERRLAAEYYERCGYSWHCDEVLP